MGENIMKIEAEYSNLARIQRLQEALRGDGGFTDEFRRCIEGQEQDSWDSEVLSPLAMHHQLKNMADVLSREELSMLQQMFPATTSARGAAAYRANSGEWFET